jgi:ElaB/YqjD/DUF883 family membrane-anchored ribosome-binding protein
MIDDLEFRRRIRAAIASVIAEFKPVLRRSAEIANEIAEASRAEAEAKVARGRGWEANDRDTGQQVVVS